MLTGSVWVFFFFFFNATKAATAYSLEESQAGL